MESGAIEILDSHRTMAISTLRPDGWPQTTIVGYANDGLTLYFLIFRSSQKFHNITADNRVALAVGGNAKDLSQLTAVYAGAHALEVTDPGKRSDAWRLLVSRHPKLIEFEFPDEAETAMMMAECKYVSVLDYRKGPGHTEEFIVGDGTAALAPKGKTEAWGSSAGASGSDNRQNS